MSLPFHLNGVLPIPSKRWETQAVVRVPSNLPKGQLMKILKTAAIILASLPLGLSTASAALDGGGFENNLLSWTASGNVAAKTGTSPYAATEGTKLAVFNSVNSNPTGILSRVVPTAAGVSYRLEFDAGVLAYNTNVQRLGVSVVGNSALVTDTVSITGTGTGALRWVAKNYTFTANSATTTLTFQDLSLVTNSVDLLLDNVRLTSPSATLQLTSTPNSGVRLEVAPPDLNGQIGGTTALTRSYNPGTSVQLFAPIESGGGTFYHWLEGGVGISTDQTIDITMNGDRQLAAVYWNGATTITRHPENVTSAAGGSAIFRAAASGAAPLAYQWRYNGNPISGATFRTLELRLVQPEDAGQYDVEVTGPGGRAVSNQATLTVNSQAIANGSFESDFTGWTPTGSLSIQNSAPYQPTDGSKLAAFNSGNFPANGVLVQTLPVSQGFNYTLSFDMGVLAYNTSAQSLRVTVESLQGNGTLATQLFTMNGTGGGRTVWQTKTLSFPGDGPQVKLVFRDQSPTSNSIDLLLDRVRLVPPATRSLSIGVGGGTVTVAPSDINGLGNGTGGFTRNYPDGSIVDVLAPASYVIPLGPGKVATVRFQRWLEDGQPFSTNRGIQVTMNRDRNFSAEYLEGPPVITGHPVDVTVDAGGTATFQVTVDAPGTNYGWLFNGAPITSSGNTLVIPNAQLANAGTYQAVVGDFGGTAYSNTATLTVNGGVPAGPVIANGGFESSLAGWTSTGNVALQSAAPYIPTQGSKLVAFNTANSAPNGTLSQTFPTVPGKSYMLTFDMGLLLYTTGYQFLNVILTGNGQLASGTYGIERVEGANTVWHAKRLTFFANSANTTVSFRDVSTSTAAIDLLLDNVAVNGNENGFTPIPAGAFQMGDILGDGLPAERPAHNVQVSAFQVEQKLVSKVDWNIVRTWAATHGYTDLPEGGGKDLGHPVHSVNWFAAVKWCNARSEKDGLTPAYKVGASIYRTGEVDTVTCDFLANGYRLPTEAEWEKAARGGRPNSRFPNGDTISHFQANYYSNVFNNNDRLLYPYDISPTRGYNTLWDVDGLPYTSLVGFFPANGYGLYDMAGNVFEWCWDGYGDYSAASQVDPRGPAGPAAYRVARGSAWNWSAFEARVSWRNAWDPRSSNYERGFRVVRSSP